MKTRELCERFYSGGKNKKFSTLARAEFADDKKKSLVRKPRDEVF